MTAKVSGWDYRASLHGRSDRESRRGLNPRFCEGEFDRGNGPAIRRVRDFTVSAGPVVESRFQRDHGARTSRVSRACEGGLRKWGLGREKGNRVGEDFPSRGGDGFLDSALPRMSGFDSFARVVTAAPAIVQSTKHGEPGRTGGEFCDGGGATQDLRLIGCPDSVTYPRPGKFILRPCSGEEEPVQPDPEGREHVLEPGGGKEFLPYPALGEKREVDLLTGERAELVDGVSRRDRDPGVEIAVNHCRHDTESAKDVEAEDEVDSDVEDRAEELHLRILALRELKKSTPGEVHHCGEDERTDKSDAVSRFSGRFGEAEVVVEGSREKRGDVERIKDRPGDRHGAAPEDVCQFIAALRGDRRIDDASEVVGKGRALRNEPAIRRRQQVGSLIYRRDQSGEPIATTGNVRIGEGDHGIVAGEVAEGRDLIVYFLSFVFGEAGADEGDTAEPVGGCGMLPHRIARSCFELLGKPYRDRIVPGFKGHDDAVVAVVLRKNRVKKAGRRLEVESFYRNDQGNRLQRAGTFLPASFLPTGRDVEPANTKGRDQNQQEPDAPEDQQYAFHHLTRAN